MRMVSYLVLSLAAILPGSARAADDKALATEAMKILENHCKRCHSGAKSGGGNFDVLFYKSLFEKSDEGPAYVVPKDPAKSFIWEKIKSDEMPQAKLKLSAEEKKVVKDWIEAGAPAPILEE